VADGTVFVGSNDGNLYAIHASDDGASSRGSRALLGTLGHHDTTVSTDPATVDSSELPDSTRTNPTVLYDHDRDDVTGDTTEPTEVYTPDADESGLDGSQFCTDCGATLPASAAYCPGCGTELVSCPACGHGPMVVPPFCPACGTAFEDG
jgi:hypothetical protein